MSDTFKAIETQEQFEEIIKPRLARATETARKKALEEIQPQLDELNGFKERVTTLESTLEERNGQIKTLEEQLTESKNTAKGFELKAIKTQAIVDNGLPSEFAERLRGDNAEEIQQDAETLAQLFKANNKNYLNLPRVNNDDKVITDSKERGFKELLDNLKGE